MKVDANTLTLAPRQAKRVSMALSDALCWMQGFQAAGGDTGPCDLTVLQVLNTKIKEMNWDRAVLDGKEAGK